MFKSIRFRIGVPFTIGLTMVCVAAEAMAQTAPEAAPNDSESIAADQPARPNDAAGTETTGGGAVETQPKLAPASDAVVSEGADANSTVARDIVADATPPAETEEETTEMPAPPIDLPVDQDPAFKPSVNFGVGLRAQYSLDPKVTGANFAQAVGTNIRPYISGEAFTAVKFEANLDSTFAPAASAGDLAVDPASGNVTDANGDGTVASSQIATVRLLDAVIKIEPHELANFWFGRFLPPTDRANLSGPYYQNAWNYPVQSNLYPAIYAGRHDGMAYWGQVGGGKFKWQLGVFDLTGGDNPLAAGRVVVNLLDPEPGYYNSSTYYGSQDVLAIGAVAQYQKAGDTAAGLGLDGSALSADLLFEKELSGSGTFTAEASYYNFKGTDQGSSVWGLLAYLLPGKQGPGTLQGVARLQTMMPEAGEKRLTLDAAVNYILIGHNARFTLNYQHMMAHDEMPSDQVITFGGQLQL